ncbi:Ethylene-responsive transcription factor, partial [Cucurbita argyrosperma subsp. argyrosperma]
MKGGEEERRNRENTKPYKGIRMRKWGKWVAEIREPNKRSRIWLGSYSSPVAAARAYDTAVFHLRGPSARLNFPDFFTTAAADRPFPLPADISASTVRKIAAEVGARVDALESSLRHHFHNCRTADQTHQTPSPSPATTTTTTPTKLRSDSGGFSDRVDLNKLPDPEDSDGDCASTPWIT